MAGLFVEGLTPVDVHVNFVLDLAAPSVDHEWQDDGVGRGTWGVGAFHEAVSEHAPGRPSSNDDEIECAIGHVLAIPN